MEVPPAVQNDEDQPAQLVRRDTCNIRKARAAFIGIVSLATAIGAWNAHRVLHQIELANFDREFNNTAQKLVKSLMQSTHRKFAIGHDHALVVKSAILQSSSSSLTNLSIPIWQDVCASALYIDSVYFVAISPLISTIQEAQELDVALNAKVTTPLYPPCFLCDDELERFVNPHSPVHYPGQIVVTCQEVEQAGLSGLAMNEDVCRQMKPFVQQFCQCGPMLNNSSTTSTTTIEINTTTTTTTSGSKIFRLDSDTGFPVPEDSHSLPYVPILELAGRGMTGSAIGWNQYSDIFRSRALENVLASQSAVFSETYVRTGSLFDNYLGHNAMDILGLTEFYPIIIQDKLVGVLTVDFGWTAFVKEVFPAMAQYMTLVVDNTCGQTFTFTFDEIQNNLVLIGEGDQHDRSFDHMVQKSTIYDFENLAELVTGTLFQPHNESNMCRYHFSVYPTKVMKTQYLSNKPLAGAIGIVLITFVSFAVFFIYDCLVEKRQDKVLVSAAQNAAVVSMLYPPFVRGRLFHHKVAKPPSSRPRRTRLGAFLLEEPSIVNSNAEPIAEFFPSVSVMFLDLVGFTAWCSNHEPKHVFRLLETLYQGFDQLARERGIFKVETIGDCYLAVAGLPEPCTDHAVMIAWFAHDCIEHLKTTFDTLANSLGTAHLSARCGIHSGPVVAGVLRGDKARFQLFGDVLNTCSRLESSSFPNQIHASHDTVQLLEGAGYAAWATARPELVQLKGKGELQTYWVLPK